MLSGTAAKESGPAAQDSALLTIADLWVSYGAVTAVRGVSLEVGAGEVVALLGANGAGKSTILRAISGLVRPCAGHIQFIGAALDRLPPARIVKLGISHCPEGRHVFGSLSVLENLRLGASSRSDRAGIAADREHLFGLFPILGERRHQAAGTLSGGEQQMLALARALIARPKLLLLDEPSLGLAPLVVQHIFRSLAELKRQGLTMLLVEQNMNLALGLADRAYILRTGKVCLSGTAQALDRDLERVSAAYLGQHA